MNSKAKVYIFVGIGILVVALIVFLIVSGGSSDDSAGNETGDGDEEESVEQADRVSTLETLDDYERLINSVADCVYSPEINNFAYSHTCRINNDTFIVWYATDLEYSSHICEFHRDSGEQYNPYALVPSEVSPDKLRFCIIGIAETPEQGAEALKRVANALSVANPKSSLNLVHFR